MLLLALLACPEAPPESNLTEEIEALRQENEDLAARIEALEAAQSTSDAGLETVVTDITALDAELATVEASAAAIDARVTAIEADYLTSQALDGVMSEGDIAVWSRDTAIVETNLHDGYTWYEVGLDDSDCRYAYLAWTREFPTATASYPLYLRDAASQPTDDAYDIVINTYGAQYLHDYVWVPMTSGRLWAYLDNEPGAGTQTRLQQVGCIR